MKCEGELINMTRAWDKRKIPKRVEKFKFLLRKVDWTSFGKDYSTVF